MPKKIKVLLGIGSLVSGGAETQCRLLAEGLDRDRFDVGLVCFKDKGRELYPHDVSIFCVGSRQEKSLLKRFKGIKDAVKSFAPDVILAVLPETMSIPLAVIGRFKSIPVITSRRTTFLSLFKGGPLRQYLNLLAEIFSKKVVSNSNVMLKNSYLYKKIFDFRNGIVIRNGVNLDFDSKDEAMCRRLADDKNLKIVFVGRFIPTKRIDILIESFAKLKSKGESISLYLCGGEKENFPELKSILEKYKISDKDLHFLGFVKNWTSFGGEFDLFAFPSVLEGMPNVIVEAISQKLPVLACNIDAISDIVEDGKEAVLVAPNNQEEFEKALEDLLKNESKRNALVENSQKIIPKFTKQKMVESYESLFLQLINKK